MADIPKQTSKFGAYDGALQMFITPPVGIEFVHPVTSPGVVAPVQVYQGAATDEEWATFNAWMGYLKHRFADGDLGEPSLALLEPPVLTIGMILYPKPVQPPGAPPYSGAIPGGPPLKPMSEYPQPSGNGYGLGPNRGANLGGMHQPVDPPPSD